MPENIRSTVYPGQPESEVTQRVIYKHFISIAPFVMFMFIMLCFIVIAALVYSIYPDVVTQYIPAGIFYLVGFLFMALSVFIFLSTLWIWRNNKVIITDEHIVDVDQIGLFSRNVSTLRLGEIQDISATVHGPAQMTFKYGTIVIQTAGERANFVFDYVPEPYAVEHYILEIRKKYLSKKA